MSRDGRWVTYMCWIGEDYGFVSVDLEPADSAADAARPYGVSVEVTCREPSESGLPGTSELDALHSFEAALAIELEPGRPIGHATHGGVRTSYLYSDDGWRDEQRVYKMAERLLPDHEVRVVTREDPGWERYFQFLYPNKQAWRYIEDNQVLAVLQEHGDDGSVPREIEHWAYFPSRGQRRSFSKSIKGLGYRVTDKSTGESDDPRRFGLQFESVEAMAPAQIHSHTERLVLLADEHGGQYDGWETRVIAPDG